MVWRFAACCLLLAACCYLFLTYPSPIGPIYIIPISTVHVSVNLDHFLEAKCHICDLENSLSKPKISLAADFSYLFFNRTGLQCCSPWEAANWKVECVQVGCLHAKLHFASSGGLYHLFLSCRSAHSPLRLINKFPDNPEIGTLHDNFV